MYQTVKQVSKFVDLNQNTTRTEYSVLASLVSEIGELAQEIAIVNNQSYKEPSTDGVVGVVGEAVDCQLPEPKGFWLGRYSKGASSYCSVGGAI